MLPRVTQSLAIPDFPFFSLLSLSLPLFHVIMRSLLAACFGRAGFNLSPPGTTERRRRVSSTVPEAPPATFPCFASVWCAMRLLVGRIRRVWRARCEGRELIKRRRYRLPIAGQHKGPHPLPDLQQPECPSAGIISCLFLSPQTHTHTKTHTTIGVICPSTQTSTVDHMTPFS